MQLLKVRLLDSPRCGYTLTSETKPFPYGDDRFGKPLRDDLHFIALEKAP